MFSFLILPFIPFSAHPKFFILILHLALIISFFLNFFFYLPPLLVCLSIAFPFIIFFQIPSFFTLLFNHKSAFNNVLIWHKLPLLFFLFLIVFFSLLTIYQVHFSFSFWILTISTIQVTILFCIIQYQI